MRPWQKNLYHAVVTLLGLALLYLSAQLYRAGYAGLGVGLLLVDALAVTIYVRARAYTWRYLFPGLVGFALFVIFPLLYTVYVSFTNYSSANLLRFPQVVRYFQDETYLASDAHYPFKLYLTGEGTDTAYTFELTDAAADSPQTWRTDPIKLPGSPQTIPATSTAPAPSVEALTVRDIIKLRSALQHITIKLPDGTLATNTGLRDFAPRHPLWKHDPADDTFENLVTGETIRPNDSIGRYVIATPATSTTPPPPAVGTPVGPGYRTWIGLANYTKVFTDKGIQGPFLKIFIWTVIFALGSVAFSLAVGMFLAVLLEWKELPFRRAYRTLLILPYAVPAFISILIFKGLFNQNFGEINLILHALFGIKPEWFADPTLAKLMILIVNTWLGFPYMMIVCTGILQSVPDTIYEASAIDGSNAIHDFFKLTLPLIFKPLFPLLVASFAFNFNNFLLIYLLTAGGPDMVGAATPAGQTDILVSYTFRIAFRDSAQNFGYASAIATVIFIIVALISWWNLRKQIKT
ncbi:maltose ABC transporter permease MalF [Geminisphaera colitermitum]|uniref:maltose ABC transporter permease MalF n=1 Tax=Geminisphaera colitermitum TaxID=1148786 RepID=UPI0005BE9539